jgi:hypothetical protein
MLNRWTYVLLTVLGLACMALPVLFTILAVLVITPILWIYLRSTNKEDQSRRTYEASCEATYIALCGAVGSLGYRVTANDPTTCTLRFKTGWTDLWIWSSSMEYTASVRQIDNTLSEISLAGRVSQEDIDEWRESQFRLAKPPYPGVKGPAAKKILDRVAKTVITYPVIDGALAAPQIF